MVNLSDLLFLGGDMPLVLTVGIGYPVGSDIDYVFERRAKDLVNPTGQEGPGHDGVAPLFLRFIREELWPWLSERFDVSEDRTLRGHSLPGGQPSDRSRCRHDAWHAVGILVRPRLK